jgi:hypothetical protein
MNLHGPVMIVAHPSGNAEDMGFTFHKPAKADALHPTADEETAGKSRR